MSMKTIPIPAREVISAQPAAISPQIRELLPGASRLPQTDLAAGNLLIPNGLPIVPIQRLIVLVPAGEFDELALTRRVWELAGLSGLQVMYLSLSPDEDQYAYQRRRLIGLAASTTCSNVRADTGIYVTGNWIQVLRQLLKPGDLLVCMAEDYTSILFRRRSVGEWLAKGLSIPIYEFGGIPVKPAPPSRYWINNLFSWVALIALMAAFFWLQVVIDRSAPEPQSSILLYLSVLVEIYFIWKINEWIG